MPRGFFGIGIEHCKTAVNVGTLWRSADLLGASFIFTIGRRYKRQCSDTLKSYRHVPLWHFETFAQLKDSMPLQSLIVGVELADASVPIEEFAHPERAVYVLGAEDHGLTKATIAACHKVVRLPGRFSMNVASAGTVVLYDRIAKRGVMTRTIAAE